jgi:hypothetical protein
LAFIVTISVIYIVTTRPIGDPDGTSDKQLTGEIPVQDPGKYLEI